MTGTLGFQRRIWLIQTGQGAAEPGTELIIGSPLVGIKRQSNLEEGKGSNGMVFRGIRKGIPVDFPAQCRDKNRFVAVGPGCCGQSQRVVVSRKPAGKGKKLKDAAGFFPGIMVAFVGNKQNGLPPP